jgi:hypothetical protein
MCNQNELIIWKREMFPQGSVGQVVFIDELEGRLRTNSFLRISGRDAIYGHVKTWKSLDDEGITTTEDLLMYPEQKLPLIVRKGRIDSLIYNLSWRLAKKVLLNQPEGYLIGALLAPYHEAAAEQLIPNSQEPARHEAVLSAIDTLQERRKRILLLRFGLIDGNYIGREEIGREFNRTREGIKQIEFKAIRQLRTAKIRRELSEFFPWIP